MKEASPSSSRPGGRFRWLALFALVLTLGLVVAACGGDDSAEEAAPPPAEEAAPVEEPAPEPPAEEAAPVEEPAAEPPAEEPPAEPVGCSVEGIDDDVINVFAAADTPSAVIGENISPASHGRMSDLWIADTNAAGGILGCQVEFVVDDDTFDIDTCVRQYKDALASGEYDFYIGPTNSGCMASIPPLVNAAGKWLFTGIAADHQPFFDPAFPDAPFVAQPSVSTFLEGRAIGVFAAQQGWQAPASMVPNYAYGQDVGKGFNLVYGQLVPEGTIVNEQFPEVTETEFTAFINGMLAQNPDGIFTAFFAASILPIMKQWQATGLETEIDFVGGLASLDFMYGVGGPDDIPENFYGYDRGNYRLVGELSPIAAKFVALWDETYGAEFPLADSFTMQLLATWQMAKTLIEETGSVDPEKWKARIETGDFAFEGPYNAGPTNVNPQNHMANSCASVAKIVWDDENGWATFDPDTFVQGCMIDVLPKDEAIELTTNPDVTEEAIDKYYELASGGS